MNTSVLGPLETTWEEWILDGGARASFANPDLPLEVELGPGEDDFLVDQAEANPGRNWLGIEYSRKRVHRYVRKILARSGPLDNVRLIWRPATDLVGSFLTPAIVHAYHVYFPDPWPKKHHQRFRLLTGAFFRVLRESLVPGGVIYMLTDHEDYATEIVAASQRVPGLTSTRGKTGYQLLPPGHRSTVFECRWRRQGLPIYQLELVREAES